MRAIPPALRARLLDRFKAEGLNNEPRLRLIAKQTTGHTLLTEPIHEDIAADFGDVAFRQLEGEREPSLAFAVCIDNGIAEVYSRQLPSDLDSPWTERWRYGAATDAAIEFNGVWTMDVTKEWYYLRTEEYPYLFTIEGGELYVQHWTDTSTRTQLASGVSNISVCRGWQSSDDPLIDQGLIAGYIRGGRVYYRALCYQEDGSLFWETEREVTELGTNNTSLSVIRTNDFRVGFLTEVGSGTDMRLVLTGRSYAGQSVRPESVLGQVVDRCRITATPIRYEESFSDDGRVTGIPTDGDFYVGNFMQEQACSIVSYERTSSTTIVVTFDHALLKRKDFHEYVTVIPNNGSANPASITGSVDVSGSSIIITTSEPMDPKQVINVQLYAYSRVCFLCENSSPQPIQPFAIELEALDYVKSDDGSVAAAIALTNLRSIPIEYRETEYEEHGLIQVTYLTPTLTATQVGPIPV